MQSNKPNILYDSDRHDIVFLTGILNAFLLMRLASFESKRPYNIGSHHILVFPTNTFLSTWRVILLHMKNNWPSDGVSLLSLVHVWHSLTWASTKKPRLCFERLSPTGHQTWVAHATVSSTLSSCHSVPAEASDAVEGGGCWGSSDARVTAQSRRESERVAASGWPQRRRHWDWWRW